MAFDDVDVLQRRGVEDEVRLEGLEGGADLVAIGDAAEALLDRAASRRGA